MSLINRAKSSLAKLGVAEWRINDVLTESSEYFFVKKQLDTRRSKAVEKCEVTVFVTEDGKKGSVSVQLTPAMASGEIESKISGALYAASFALNPDYALPDPVRGKRKAVATVFGEGERIMIEALFSEDNRPDSFINSAEIFFTESKKRVISSNGTDVSWTTSSVRGEYVVQCREPEDVELFNEFEYDAVDAASLSAKVSADLDYARDRARAERILKSGEYDVILCGDQLPELLSYYEARSGAHMIYPGYSEWKPGDAVQKTAGGEKLTITLRDSEPFSREGIKMKDLPLIKNGVLKAVHGENRFCRYLGVRPTGTYEKLVCENPGRVSFEEMKKKPCLWTVAYSDFQTDSFTGNFGGEIRLAYLIEDGKATPVTGGSINGRLPEVQDRLEFSKERYLSSGYEGPFAVRIPGVAVAGTEN